MNPWLLDTEPLVAFFDRSEECHAWVREKWAHAPVPMLTCEAVLAEATYLLGERAGLPAGKVLAPSLPQSPAAARPPAPPSAR